LNLRRQLRERRLQLGLTQQEVADRAAKAFPAVKGLLRTAFRAWEQEAAGRSPSDEQLVAWATALDMTIEVRASDEAA